MKICKKCVLPETYPGIKFDHRGICNFCTEHARKKKINNNSADFVNEEEVIKALEKYKSLGGKYDVLVSASGGVDSSYALIQVVEKYQLHPLVWHNDHGYEHETATNNVRKLCKALDLDLVIWQHDISLMKKLWKYSFESQVSGAATCFICANVLYWNAVELAKKNNIKLIVNGYSKGQAALNKKSVRGLLNEFIAHILQSGDMEFFDWFINKYQIMNIHKEYQCQQDLLDEVDTEKVMVIPFFIFQFYATDKEYLKKVCKERFDWQQIENPYPLRTTNCQMNWLTTFVDLTRWNYSIYTDEYSSLTRKGEITREQALADLQFNPPQGLLEQLASEVGTDLTRITRVSGDK